MKFWLLLLLGLVCTFSVANAQDSTDVELIELASFETRYGDFGRSRARAHNIRHASSMVSEVVLEPGDEFSFNDSVGQRTEETGFREAPVILSGRVGKDFGGGICQLASTIHAAALYAGLEVVEHYPHTRISSYIRPGLDATVDWATEKDLVIRNSFSYPVVMRVDNREGRLPGERFVSVTFTAKQQTYDVRIEFFETAVEPFGVVEVVDDSLEPGEEVVQEPGTNSMNVTVRRILEPLRGEAEATREQKFVMYPASDRVVAIGPEQ